MSDYTIHTGDCVEVMRTIPDASVDSIVTDPPYGLSFMGKKWDVSVPGVDVWAEALRVMKPGGHLLAFAGTRTQHRMCCNIEDAGFEIRDLIAWVYGSGFPKSHNLDGDREGWGTALKPAMEPITVARKPLIGTVAANVQAFGTGALNVDGCRVGTETLTYTAGETGGEDGKYGIRKRSAEPTTVCGRWPANLIHDGSEEVVGLFPMTQSGMPMFKTHTDPGRSVASGASKGGEYFHTGFGDSGSAARFFYCAKASGEDRGDTNNHPTVKPTELMRYLCRLVTQPNGVVLDPFMGSGSTGKASRLEGFRFIGIERDAAYIEIARARIAAAVDAPLFTQGATA